MYSRGYRGVDAGF